MSSRTYDELALPFLASIYPPVLQSIDLLVELIDKQCKSARMVNSKKVSKCAPPTLMKKKESKTEKVDGLERNLGKAQVRLG